MYRIPCHRITSFTKSYSKSIIKIPSRMLAEYEAVVLPL